MKTLACLHVLGQPGLRVGEPVQLGVSDLRDYVCGGKIKVSKTL